MISDDELDRHLLSQMETAYPKKVMRIIAGVFQQDIGYKCRSIRLWGGFGNDEPDAMLDRCIDRLGALAAAGKIEAIGDLSIPGRSEVRRL
jgi:hypothetical protein